MCPHSNAKAFAYNADKSNANDAATTTSLNGWAVPEALDELTTAAPTAPDGEMRLDMHRGLQREVQAESALINMFQTSCQAAMDEVVTGHVNGAKSDLVH